MTIIRKNTTKTKRPGGLFSFLSKASPSRIAELDALRGIAAIMVVIGHFAGGYPAAQMGLKLGLTGVHLFFMISGFVIFMTVQKLTRPADFVINRISRLYPTYWACVTIAFLHLSLHAMIANHSIPIAGYLVNMTMFQHYFGVPHLDDVYWTLTVEMVFYIGMLLIMVLGLLDHIINIGVVCLLGIIALKFFLPDYAFSLVAWALPIVNYAPLFFAGILFYKIYARPNSRSKPMYYSLILLSFIAQVSLDINTETSYITHIQFIGMIGLYFLLFTLFVNNKLRFIVSGPTVFLGTISYSLYLIHHNIGTTMMSLMVKRFGIDFWVAFYAVVSFVVLLAAGITYLIEIPFSRKLRNSLRLRPA